jgi:hypothetical protein
MTAADFAQYRAIILGDPRCQGVSAAQAAVNNRMVWGPVVNGNVFIIGTDPAFHGKTLVAQKGIAFATAAAGKTGAYIATSCYGTSAASLLTGLSTLGTFTAVGTSGDNALKVAEHPALDGLTSAYLSNWFSAVHNGFSTWPSDFEVLGIIGTGTVYRSPDGTFVGTPYILARGEGLIVVSDIAITPLTATKTVGATHTFTATVKANGAPVSGTTVTFKVEDGPTAGTTLAATTDANGQASYTITGTVAGTYGVRARFTDSRNIEQVSGRATVTFEVPADASAPVITPVITGTVGEGDWYTSDVGLTWTVVDNDSPITSQTGCGPATVNTDGSQSFTCSATSTGGTSSQTVTLKRDVSAPLLDANVVGAQGANDWYTGTVNVTWNKSDPTSGIQPFHSHDEGAVDPCLDRTVTSNTAGVTFACTVENGAGLKTTKSVFIKRDASAPTVSGALVGTLGNNGWYVSDVAVNWTTADDVSGATPCASSFLTSDNAGASFSCSTTNGAGMTASGSVGPIKRDATKPAIGFSGNAGSYTVDQTVAITCAASDNLSGLAGTTGCATITGAAYSFAIGNNGYTATATDKAGNSSSASTSFTVNVTGGSLCTLIKRFVDNAGVANSMCVKVTQQSWGALKNELSAQSGKKISEPNAAIVASLVDVLAAQ